MQKYIIFFLLLLESAVFSQRGFDRGEGRRPELNLRKPVLIESHVIPADTSNICYFTYKIPFNNILFVKDGNNFTGAISLKFEVHKDEEYIKSELVNNKISVNDYDLTNSDSDYLEGILSINLSAGKYVIKPTLKLENLNKDIMLRPFPLEITDDSLNVFEPIPVYTEKYTFDNSELFRLINSEGVIPYSINSYNMIIPVADSAEKINVVITQDSTELLNRELTEIEEIGFGIKQIDNSVCLFNDSNNISTKLFLLTDFSTKLHEGPAEVTVLYNGNEKDFIVQVGWLNKPTTLYNPEFAIKILENVTPSPEVDELTDGDEENYYHNLVEYWKKFDQNKSTAFNEVMNEFYRRADFAVKEYATPNHRDGTKTDRGKIYIKYGEPDKVDRSYSEKNNIIEIWYYNNISKKFVFSDQNGLGNFTLLK